MERNARWWAEHHSIAQAVEWFECVHNQLKSLVDNPERHGLSMENADFHYEVRDLLVGLASRPSYRAVFTLQGHRVYVLAIRRSAEDRLSPELIDVPSSIVDGID